MTVRGDTDHDRVLTGTQTGQTPKPMLLKLQSLSKMGRKQLLVIKPSPTLGRLGFSLAGFPLEVASRSELSGRFLLPEFSLSLHLRVLSFPQI